MRRSIQYSQFQRLPPRGLGGLNAENLQEELDAIQVFLNGPRHWVINGAEGNVGPTSAKISSFGNLQMSRPGLLDLENLNEMPSTGVKYIEHEVARIPLYDKKLFLKEDFFH